MATEAELGERAQHFLKVLIERYIREGQPVGSRTLARDAGLELSPATIRNVLADLEHAGLIHSPHTSAGRVPTVSGYRLFVDSLISLQPLADNQLDRLREELSVQEMPQNLVASASKVLSGLTHMAGVVTIPKRVRILVKEVQFVPLTANRILAILVTTRGEILNRVIDSERAYDRNTLEQAANFINHHYSGLELSEIKEKILLAMNNDRQKMDLLMAEALNIASQAVETPEKEDLVVTGQTNLMDFDELAHMSRIRNLFEAFSEKQEILHLLEKCNKADGVQLFIGGESGYRPFEQCSLVTAPYSVDGKVVGVLGVIGPTRMAYERVIPIVDVTAKLLGAALKSN